MKFISAPVFFSSALLMGQAAAQDCVGPSQAYGIGSCFSYSHPQFNACQGACTFTQVGNTCNIVADSSTCPTQPICTCKINGKSNRICAKCTPTPASAEEEEPLEFGIPDINGTCATEYTDFFTCYANSVGQDGSPCLDFSAEGMSNALAIPTTCDAANDALCDSGLLVGCCDDKIKAIAECAAKENLGLDCDIDCGDDGSTSAGYAYRKALVVSAVAAGIAGLAVLA